MTMLGERSHSMRAAPTAKPAATADRGTVQRDEAAFTLSVVIPCLNAGDTIGIAIERLTAQGWTEPWEIVVADNGSEDATRQVVGELATRHEHLRLVDASGPHMAAYARNVGARAARG